MSHFKELVLYTTVLLLLTGQGISRVGGTSAPAPSPAAFGVCKAVLQDSWGQSLGSIPTLIAINLSSCSIDGSLPASWGQAFQYLTVLDLSNLNQADPENATFNATMPAEWGEAGAWPQLNFLHIGFATSVTGAPAAKLQPGWDSPHTFPRYISSEWGTNGAFPALETLYINNASNGAALLGGRLPSQWGRSGGVPSLRQLDLSGNVMTGTLPESWGRQLNLSTLTLNDNFFSGTLPPAWGDMGLEDLSLSGNYLHEAIPDEWSGMTVSIYPGNRGVCGPIPESLVVLNTTSGDPVQNLTEHTCGWESSLLAFANSLTRWTNSVAYSSVKGWGLQGDFYKTPFCDWTGITCEKGTIIGLDLAGLGVNGTFRQGLEGLSTLRSLNLSSNFFHGSLPRTLDLPELRVLNLSANQITGTLAEEWGTSTLQSLEGLSLASNSIRGSLPDWEGAFPNLGSLTLADCLIQSTLPASWSSNGTFPKLAVLSLAGNRIEGTLHNSWGSDGGLPLLQGIDLSFNRLSGTLPSTWCQQSNLRAVELQSNQLVGALPESWAERRLLTWLSLANNKLSGSITSSWGTSWPRMFWLDLSNNMNINGTVPSTFGADNGLHALSYNPYVFSGVPIKVSAANFGFAAGRSQFLYEFVAGLDLSNMSLSGVLPASLTQGLAAAALLPGNAGLYSLDASTSNHTFEIINTAASRWVRTIKPNTFTNVSTGYKCDILCSYPAYIRNPATAAQWGFDPASPAELPFPVEGLGPIMLKVANKTNLGPSLLKIANKTANLGSTFGWQDDGTPACNWTGVICDPLSSHIISINLSSTSITGPLSPLWGNITGLQSLDLSLNKFTGSLPPEWASSFSNATFNLGLANLLIPALPGGWSGSGAFPALRTLDVSRNAALQSNSSFLPAFGQDSGAPLLQSLQYQQSRIAGKLPSTWSTLRQLQTIDVSNNLISKGLPESWGDGLPALVSLDASSNHLTGTIPASWGNNGGLGNLTDLNLASCQLTGSLPSWPQEHRLTSLKQLSIGSNQGVCGTVPQGLPASDQNGPVTQLDACPNHNLSTGALAGIVARRRAAGNFDPLVIFFKYARSEAKSSSSYLSDSSSMLSSVYSDDTNLSPKRLTIVEEEESYKKLGEGKFGQVFQGMLDHTDDVAIKFLNPDTIKANKAHRERFESEVRIMLLCQHTNVIACMGAFIVDDLMYCVCEYAAGGDLQSALSEDPEKDFSWYKRGQQVALDMARGLAYLHENNVVHLDVKPANVLLTAEGIAKLADVGLSRMLDNKSHLSQTELGGTYDYQAPETLMGSRTTFSADIWAYGVILLEIITGLEQRRGFHTMPSDIPAQCPAHVAAMVEQCLDSEPAKRPTAKDIIRRLQRSQPAKKSYL
ncbi:hypothetical protein WJX73_007087 [Symbiochloris irregularis]|uniref:Protein kinase domain-containing protein n=1 Tax=Symbiochloris irregularis TaxID=706552 RepID=A0AAW1NKY3_9CHLO